MDADARIRLSEHELRLLDRALTVYLNGVDGRLSDDDLATEVLHARIQHTIWHAKEQARRRASGRWSND